MFLSAWCSHFPLSQLECSLHGTAFSLLRSYSSAYLDTVKCIKTRVQKQTNSKEGGGGGGSPLLPSSRRRAAGVQVYIMYWIVHKDFCTWQASRPTAGAGRGQSLRIDILHSVCLGIELLKCSVGHCLELVSMT